MDDRDLLDIYVNTASREALGELARRHVDFVYAAALRQTGDAHLAEDVTQAVFMVLLRRAHAGHDATLVGWLFNTTRYAAANAMKMQARRAYHERHAMRVEVAESSERQWEEVRRHLDGAMARLGSADRDAILLRFFKGWSLKQVAQATGTSEAAAQKR